MNRPDRTTRSEKLDLDLIAQQIQALSEMAARQHLESLERSQAKGLLELSKKATHIKAVGHWRE